MMAAVAALMAALLLLALWRLAWRPRAVARAFARQGVRGPPYAFLAGSLPEMKRLLMAGRVGVAPLDATCHDIMPVLLPQFHRWAADYGNLLPAACFFSFLFFTQAIDITCTNSSSKGIPIY
jgi:cytochrome P450 family 709